jgi:RHS repeat-associated protein
LWCSRGTRDIERFRIFQTTGIATSMSTSLRLSGDSFVYGPGGLPIEQINNTTGTVTYLHHDQQGSTRLLTGSTGTVTGKCTYSPYGTPTCEGSATTPLGYDGQYTSTDTGLIYMRAREYDPATAQFLSSDPLTAITWEPYSYAWDNPVNSIDPSGLEAIPIPIDGPEAPACLTPETIGPCIVVGGGGYVITEGVKSIVNAWAGEEAGNDEGEAIVKQQAEEAEQASQGECGQESPQSLPYRGEPNSTSALDRGNGTGQIRDYGPDGLPLRDFDFGHDHGFGDPHAHDWPEGVRGPGRPIGPNE